jgi:hypothetical protein
MRKIVISLLLIIISVTAFSQSVTVPRLIEMLEWAPKKIDTTLKKVDYLLMKKDVDSASSLYEYGWFDKEKDGKGVARSLILMDAHVRDMQSRLLTYRTYDKDEYQQMAAWMLANNYRSTSKYDFKEAQHTLYSNGVLTIRVKVITTQLKNGKKFIAYEWEIGK